MGLHIGSDYSGIPESEKYGDIWEDFLTTMKDNAYGKDETAQAWYFFEAGWKAHLDRTPWSY